MLDIVESCPREVACSLDLACIHVGSERVLGKPIGTAAGSASAFTSDDESD
jgi:hypothetical protein